MVFSPVHEKNRLNLAHFFSGGGVHQLHEYGKASGKFFEDTAVKDFISFINVIENGVYRDIGLYRLLSRYSDMSSLNLTSIVRHSISYINNLNLEEEYSHIGNNRVLEWIKNNQAQIFCILT